VSCTDITSHLTFASHPNTISTQPLRNVIRLVHAGSVPQSDTSYQPMQSATMEGQISRRARPVAPSGRHTRLPDWWQTSQISLPRFRPRRAGDDDRGGSRGRRALRNRAMEAETCEPCWSDAALCPAPCCLAPPWLRGGASGVVEFYWPAANRPRRSEPTTGEGASGGARRGTTPAHSGRTRVDPPRRVKVRGVSAAP
jgi:hypothetical protein